LKLGYWSFALWGFAHINGHAPISGSLVSCALALARFILPHKLNVRRVVQVGRVAFIGIEMNFQFARVIGPHEQVAKDDRATRGNL
jgi:hypothetical protein